MADHEQTALERGAELIRALARSLPETPGVYRMLDERGDALYVGKARALKKRVVSYAKTEALPVRLQRMVAATVAMEFVHTHTEAEALLLESNLIKKFKPRYNVLLRDDKSFPYIMIAGDHDFPLLAKHRGARGKGNDYFGPFVSGYAVNQTIDTLQKAFLLRNCSDNVFAQRTRPCLQYHIKRCTAPCIGYVTKEQYAAQVKDAKDFLSGKSRNVAERMAKEMQDASDRQDFEAAALLRDRIRALTSVQAQQDINIEGLGDADVIGLYRQGGQSCVQAFAFRAGQNFGNRALFPRHAEDDSDGAILSAFIAQFYTGRPVPPRIVVSHAPDDRALLEEALKTEIIHPQRGGKKRAVDFAVRNAQGALAQEKLKQAGQAQALTGVAALCGIEDDIERIEIYDNSHTGGTGMTGVMVVAGPEGFRKNAYRKFNIREAEAADDYGMMREVMKRRFREGKTEENWPGLLLIDGGQGQMNAVYDVLTELGIADEVGVLAIAKGPDRNAGRETFFLRGRDSFTLPSGDPVLHYLQRLRDEAHRFAIGAHRARRGKTIYASPLDAVPGIGAKRKKALLAHFGSGADVARAGLADLEQVEGISKAVARRIYEHFHGQ